MLFAIILGFVGVKMAWAQFSTKVKFSDIRLRIGSFALPKTPIWLSKNDKVLSHDLLLSWAVVGDFRDSEEITHQLELDGVTKILKSNEFLISVALMSEGEHHAKVRICSNSLGCGDWSIGYDFLIDIKPPQLSLNVDGYFVREAIEDGRWQIFGEGTYDQGIWKIADKSVEKEPSFENYLELRLDNQPQLRLLSFDYAFVDSDRWTDLDQPGFEVLINERSVYWQDTTSQQRGRALVDLSQHVNEELVIKIKTGQSGQSQSWLEVSHLTTDVVVLGDKEQLQLSAVDDFDQLPKIQLIWDENRVGYFGIDHASNSTNLVYKDVVFDGDGPVINLSEVVQIDNANAKYYHFLIADKTGLKKWWLQDETTKIDLELLIGGYEKKELLGKELDFWFVLNNELSKYELIAEDMANNQTKFAF